MAENLIDIRDLKKYYPVKAGVFKRHVADVKAVDGVNLKIRKGECLGLVGESGCGKTTMGKTLLRLHDASEGRIYFDQETDAVEDLESRLTDGQADDPQTKKRRNEMDMTTYTG
ncbi:MAG: ATP-binding cassette domain-containing protein, partial [Spirochaetia bacterium]